MSSRMSSRSAMSEGGWDRFDGATSGRVRAPPATRPTGREAERSHCSEGEGRLDEAARSPGLGGLESAAALSWARATRWSPSPEAASSSAITLGVGVGGVLVEVSPPSSTPHRCGGPSRDRAGGTGRRRAGRPTQTPRRSQRLHAHLRQRPSTQNSPAASVPHAPHTRAAIALPGRRSSTRSTVWHRPRWRRRCRP